MSHVDPDGKSEYLFRLSMEDYWFTHKGQNPNYRSLKTPGHMDLQTELCKQSDMDNPIFSYWNDNFNLGNNYHAKQWEYGYVLQSLYEAGVLKEGSSGVGYGVGKEVMASMMVSRGCKVLCTDQAPENAGAWATTEQFSKSIDTLYYPFCDKAQWDKNASFREVDMNFIPPDLGMFDFCWSICSLEHLGSIQHGWDFILNTIKHLKPGGVAVHTTAYNVESNTDTFEVGPTCWYRKKDVEALHAAAPYHGCKMTALNLDSGNRPLDRLIDKGTPYHTSPVLKLMVGPYVTTCIGMKLTKDKV